MRRIRSTDIVPGILFSSAALLLVAPGVYSASASWLDTLFKAEKKPDPPYVEPRPSTEGGKFYKLNCLGCHGDRGTGTVMLAKRLSSTQSPILSRRRDLDPAYVEAVVRNGLGIMPRFTKIELPDDRLKSLQDYLSEKQALDREMEVGR